MSKKFLQILSMLLTIILVANLLPLNVFAQELQKNTAYHAQPPGTDIESSQIVEEITEERTEFSKQFRLNNGLQMAVLYAEPVHYEKDGQWLEIDNTLTAHTDGTFTNTAGIWNVQFPQTLGGSNSVVIEKDGYTLSFSLGGEVKQNELQMSTTDLQALDRFGVQESEATVISLDTEEMRRASDYPETVPEKNYGRLRYNQVFPNTAIQYDLQGNTVKESIVISAYDPVLRGYRYTLNAGQMTPQLLEDGRINFYATDGETLVMTMPAPYLEDAAGDHCDNVQVELSGENGQYVLTYTVDQQWLASDQRTWPVILDPVVEADLSRSNIEDRTVAERNANGEGWGMNACGYSAKYGIHRCYLQYLWLPSLTSSDVILGATVSQYKAYASSTITTVEVHKVTETWESANISWADKPDFDDSVEDYAIVDPVAWYSWDVTDIVRDWYANGNTGMMFKATNAIETGGKDNFKQFLSENYGVAEYRPQLEIIFCNNNGLENYWDYTSASAGRAGTGYVNTYTGNLVWTRSDIGFGGNRMPVAISHIYNANDSITVVDDNNSNDTSANFFGLGNGWRTNFHQRIGQWSEDDDYYFWEDGDGTDHYFQYKSKNTYVDEDGLELTLTTGGSGNSTYKLTDKMGNISYFDSCGRLVKQENNQKEKSSIQITYTTASGPQIQAITDGVGRVYAFTYTDDLLTQITYLGTGTEPVSYVCFQYTSGNLTRVTDYDGEWSEYTYSGNILTGANDVDGYAIELTYTDPAEAWQPYRVVGVAERDNRKDGGGLTLEYAHNQTTLTDHNGIVNIRQYNNSGNLICVQDDEGHAQYAKYALDLAATETVANPKSNQLRLSSNMQNTVGNRLQNSGFEAGSAWYGNSSNITVGRTTEYAYEGQYSLKLTSSASSTVAGLCPNFPVAPGETFTFSAYVKTTTGKAVVALHCGADNSSKLGVGLKYDKDWTRLSVTYTNNTDATRNMCPVLFLTVPGTVYMDNIQVEKTPTPSRYNRIENGDFRFGTAGWTGSNYTSVTLGSSAAPSLENTALEVVGNPSATRQLTQTVKVSGNAGDTLVLTGWAKGDSAPLHGNRSFTLTATVKHTDGTSGTPVSVDFNPGTENWQYAAVPIVPKKAYSSVTVKISYDYNINTAYFDGIQLYREEFGSSYTYDADGNVISVVDLQKQETTYEYTDNDLTKAILPIGAELTYTYDDYHNVLSSTTQDGRVYSFEYDDYGNNTLVSISDGSTTVSSYATYTTDGNRMVSTTDALGKVTTYEYHPDTNMLTWVQYPEDTPDSRTEYTYDAMYRIATVAATTDTGLDMSVAYTYEDDYLTQVETPTTIYDFTYGSFGLRASVKIGSRPLASYRYTNDRNFYLAGIDYGNDDSVNYTYDNKGRVLSATYEDGDTVRYAYDNSGRLATVTDSATGRTITYTYDFSSRMVMQEETGTNYSHSIAYGYDAHNNLSTLTEIINGVTHTTAYEYDADNRVTAKTTDGITVEYTYDGLGRITQQVTKNGDTTVKTETYTFNPNSAQVHTYRTQAGSYDVTYTYTYDDNGNILTVSDGTNTTSYVYDSQNQLIRENNQAGGFTHTWTYDNAGNIQNRAEYAYTTGALTDLSAADTAGYTYGDEEWGDLLTAFDGAAITYDGIGNPTTYRGYALTWEHGRQLAAMSNGSQTWTYTYDANGMRTGKTGSMGGSDYTYVYNGSQLVQMTKSGVTMDFTYDDTGTPLTLSSGDEVFYYITNLQGDVTGLVDQNGMLCIQYTYDAWGNFEITNVNNSTVVDNPLTYRGYVYDHGTGLYYLQSRYYDPSVGRFINADSVISGADGSIQGKNAFAYCFNNPCNGEDFSGYWPKWLKKAVAAVAVVAVVAVVATVTVATAGTGTAIAAIAVGAAKGAAIGCVAGAATGAVGGAISHRIATGSWKGAGQAALEGMADGALSGAISGAISGGFNGGLSYNSSSASTGKGFDTFTQLKNEIGSPGPGNEWHHIVEQCQITKSGFSPQMIQNTKNIVSVGKTTHRAISGYYSSKQLFTNGMTVRNWLAGQSFDSQYKFGIEILNMFM